MAGKMALVYLYHKRWKVGGGGRGRGKITANPPVAAAIIVWSPFYSLVEAGAGFNLQLGFDSPAPDDGHDASPPLSFVVLVLVGGYPRSGSV